MKNGTLTVIFIGLEKRLLMDTSYNTNPDNRRSLFSDPYSVFSAQFTKKFENTDVYIGAENIL